MASYFESGFMGGNTPAWHGLGTVIEEDCVTANRAIELAELDWSVNKYPLVHNGHTMNGKFIVERSSDGKPLGIVGKNYNTFQNWELFDLAGIVVSQDLNQEAAFHTAGSLKGGELVWALLKLGAIFPHGDHDEKIEEYMMLSAGHNGKDAINIAMTDVRVVCSNTQALALSEATRKWSVRHTSTLDGRIMEARTALEMNRLYSEGVKRVAEDLMLQAFSRKNFHDLVLDLIPTPEMSDEDASSRAVARAKNKQQDLWSVYVGSDNLGNIRGTKWGALQAVVEYNDHVATRRKLDRVEGRENRLMSIVGGSQMVTDAQALLTA
jgi:phage/plasmid-like protein (TIGR03299 family)